MKAILEIDVPWSCAECVLEVPSYGYGFKWCAERGDNSVTDRYTNARAPFCPLRIVEDDE